jgi:selenocysteine lyase/cysteine desulfurase
MHHSTGRAQRFRVKQPHYNGIRIATACFNNEEDIDRLLAILDTIAEEETHASSGQGA